jgi:hypothetical protein
MSAGLSQNSHSWLQSAQDPWPRFILSPKHCNSAARTAIAISNINYCGYSVFAHVGNPEGEQPFLHSCGRLRSVLALKAGSVCSFS